MSKGVGSEGRTEGWACVGDKKKRTDLSWLDKEDEGKPE